MRLYLFLLFLSAVLSASAQTIKVLPRPSWVKVHEFETVVKDTANTSNGYYDLLFDDQHNTISKESYHHYALKILSESGLENVSNITLEYDPLYESIVFHTIDVIRKGKRIDQLPNRRFDVMRREKSMEALVYNGNLTVVFNFEGLEAGDIVEYSYTLRGSNPAFKNKISRIFYLNYSVPVGMIVYRVIINSSSHPAIKIFNSAPNPELTSSKDQTIYEWVLKDVPALISDEGSPGWYDPYDYVQISDFASWGDVAQWASDLYKMNPPPLLQKIPGIKIEDKEEAVRRVIQFVQDEVRYLSFSEGIHGFKPHSSETIFNQRFGDCKDKSVLLATLLGELGINSKPVLINTNFGKALPDHLPTPGIFNHCVVQFNLRDSIYWVDPTMTLQRGSLSERHFPRYYYGLVIDPQTKSLSEIPVSKAASVSTHESFYLDSIAGGAKLKVETTYIRREANNIRDYLNTNSQKEIEKQYLNFYVSDYPEIKPEASITWKDDELKNIIVTQEEYLIPKFWSYDSVYKKYTVDIYPRNLSTYLVKPATKIRHSPYSLAFPSNITHEITLYMPEEWGVKPSRKTIETSAFLYKSRIQYDGKVIDLSYQYGSKKDFLEKNEIKEYVARIDEVFNDLNFNISHTGSVVANKNSKISYQLMVMMFVFMLIIYAIIRKLGDFDPEPKPSTEKHSSIGGWLVLPLIGICLSPFTMLYTIVDSEYFNQSNWLMLTDSSYSNYKPNLALFIVIEMLFNLFLLSLSVLLAVLFFKRRSNVPMLVFGFYLFSLIFYVGDNLVASVFVEVGAQSWSQVFRIAIGAAVWVPYFLTSERSKGTFTNRLDS